MISPLLSNIYLHHVMDVWFETVVKPRMMGKVFIVRFADDSTAGISANALAKKVELDPTTIYKIEANDSKPSLGSLESICDALGISLAEFFTEEEHVLGPEIQRLLGTAKKLSPEQIEYLQKLLESMSKD